MSEGDGVSVKQRPPKGVIECPFETAIFGAPVWWIELAPGFDEAVIAGIAEQGRNGGVALVGCRISSDDVEMANNLMAAGFRPVETLCTFETAIPGKTDDADRVLLAHEKDAGAILDLAERAFVNDRFSRDPEIDDSIARDIKRRWMANSLAGRADAVLIRRRDGRCCGFVACLLNGRVAVIDLIAVASEARGRGEGRHLVEAAFAYYTGKADVFRVGTQAVNTAAIHLYEGMGFRKVLERRTFHLTFSRNTGK